MRLSRTNLVALLAIIAGGVIGASLSFSFLGSRSADVPLVVLDVPPVILDVPPVILDVPPVVLDVAPVVRVGPTGPPRP